MKSNDSSDTFPAAKKRSARPVTFWSWTPVLLAMLALGWAGYSVYQQRGVAIRIQFQSGHGIKPGDQVKYLGLTVGFVEETALDENLDKIWVHARLNKESRGLARQGSRFWIVRPRIDLSGIDGLDTVIGARYVAALPSEEAPDSISNFAARKQPRSVEFTGLETAPIRATLPAGGLEIQLRANQRGGLRSGAPLLYRQVPVGALLSVELADDSSGVVAKAYILPDYKSLIRANTVFWNASGFRIQAGLMDGLSLSLDSLQTLISGGVALATPNPPTEPAPPGSRFKIHSKPEPEWTEWRPSIPLISIPIPEVHPQPVPIKRTWMTDYYLITSREDRTGWALITDQGILGPLEFLEPMDPAKATLPVLPSLGIEFKGSGSFTWKRRGVGLWLPAEPVWNQIKLNAESNGVLWNSSEISHPVSVTNIWLMPGASRKNSSLKPQFVSPSHLISETGAWLFMPSDWSWVQTWNDDISLYQGAVAVNAETGKLVGVFMTDPERESAWITLITPTPRAQ